jgi:hypothetical protein
MIEGHQHLAGKAFAAVLRFDIEKAQLRFFCQRRDDGIRMLAILKSPARKGNDAKRIDQPR